MVNNLFRASILALIFCVGQSLVESILAFLITHTRQASDMNFEGMLVYAFIRFILTIGPYFVVFYFTLRMTTRAHLSSIAFGLNLAVIGTFFFTGLIQKDLVSIFIASIFTSIGFIFIDKIWHFTALGKQQGKSNA